MIHFVVANLPNSQLTIGKPKCTPTNLFNSNCLFCILISLLCGDPSFLHNWFRLSSGCMHWRVGNTAMFHHRQGDLGHESAFFAHVCFWYVLHTWHSFLAIDSSFFTALFSTIAVIVFGIRGDDRDWMPGHEHNFLSWSFGLAVVGIFFAWMSTVLFWAESRILYKKELKKDQQMFNMENTAVKHWCHTAKINNNQ